MTSPVSASDRWEDWRWGCETSRSAVLVGLVGLVVESASVDHTDRCAGRDRDRVRMAPIPSCPSPSVGHSAHAAEGFGDRGDDGVASGLGPVFVHDARRGRAQAPDRSSPGPAPAAGAGLAQFVVAQPRVPGSAPAIAGVGLRAGQHLDVTEPGESGHGVSDGELASAPASSSTQTACSADPRTRPSVAGRQLGKSRSGSLIGALEPARHPNTHRHLPTSAQPTPAERVVAQ